MSDLLRIVSIPDSGRPVVELDIEDGTNFMKVRDSLEIVSGAKKQRLADLNRRFGGARVVGESQDNAQIKASWLVAGATADESILNTQALLAACEKVLPGRYLEWRPDGASYAVYFELRGTGTWLPKYQWAQFAGAKSMVHDIAFNVAPVARGLPFDIVDDFSLDTRGDYTYESGAAADESISAGVLSAIANLTVERRAIHTARGYSYGDQQETLKFTPGATITGVKFLVEVKRISATSYIEAYVDDNGTNSRLRIDLITAGSRVNRASTNLAARVSNGTAGWVRGRIEGNVLIAEYFTAAPTPMGAPTLTNTYTLSGAEITNFGAAVRGKGGRGWIPMHASATLDDFKIEPFSYRNLTLPQLISLNGTIPGDAPALCDLVVTPSGGSAAPIWALTAWAKRASTPVGGAVAPFGLIDAESGGSLSTWASAADANYRGGNGLKATTSGAGSAAAQFALDPSTIVPDEFTQYELLLELWARVELATTVVSPRMALSVRPDAGLNFGAERFSNEWGSAGRALISPSSGTRFRIVRLGTLTLDTARALKWQLRVAASWAAGSSGQFGLDYLVAVLSRGRALSPSAKPNDSSFPQFVASTGETQKTVRSDLSGAVASPPALPHPDHGLGGSLLELPYGDVDALVKLSSLVPDDPTSDATSEQLGHSAAVHFAVTPRFLLLRGS